MKNHPVLRFVCFRAAAWFWPALACAAGWRFIAVNFDAPVLFDPQYVYLPAAREFLARGWAFLLTPPSYRVVPLGYLWPALWGANPDWIRAANMGLWAGCAWFLWRASYLAGGYRAAALAMLLLAYSDLCRYFPSEMTEPIFLFGIFGLIHALARLVICKDRTSGAVVQGAAMLSITLLARPILQLIAPAALLVCLGALAATARKHDARAWRATVARIAVSLGAGLILPLMLVVKNGLAFGLWGLGTGAGASLYLGVHPLFQGTEPNFLGFDYDIHRLIGPAAHESDHLSLISDRVTRQAALWSLQTMPAADAAAFFGRKLWWWLAYHPIEIARDGSMLMLRKLRLFELSALAVGCFWAMWRWRRFAGRADSTGIPPVWTFSPAPGHWAFAATLLGIFALLIVQLLPILYNARYSVVLLDPWLIPLAACSLAWMSGAPAASASRTVSRAVILFALVAALTLAVYQIGRKTENASIDPRFTGPLGAVFQTFDETRVRASGMSRQGERTWVITESPAVFMVGLVEKDVEWIGKADSDNTLWETEIALRNDGGGKCSHAEFAYQTSEGRILQPPDRHLLLLPLKTDGQFHRLLTHANGLMRPRETGSLRAALYCPTGTVVQWRRTSFFLSRYAMELTKHVKPH
ncbi:MAG: hypothetical protein FWG56_11625 [Desulfovibrionaceae bacterium]|jgi:hypothetical protein|nr:hypothetical protein [Desulfovibrionaceae bacterium]